MKSGASDLGKTKFNGMQLHRTNLTRLIQYCEAIEQLSQKVRRYEQILENDLNKIQQTGEKIVEKTNNLKTIKNDRFKLSCKIGREKRG